MGDGLDVLLISVEIVVLLATLGASVPRAVWLTLAPGNLQYVKEWLICSHLQMMHLGG